MNEKYCCWILFVCRVSDNCWWWKYSISTPLSLAVLHSHFSSKHLTIYNVLERTRKYSNECIYNYYIHVGLTSILSLIPVLLWWNKELGLFTNTSIVDPMKWHFLFSYYHSKRFQSTYSLPLSDTVPPYFGTLLRLTMTCNYYWYWCIYFWLLLV